MKLHIFQVEDSKTEYIIVTIRIIWELKIKSILMISIYLKSLGVQKYCRVYVYLVPTSYVSI